MKQPSMTKIRRLAARAARRYGIKYSVLMGLMEQESSFRIDAVSSAGAFGLTQFIPSTAAAYGVKPGNAKSQIFGAAKYLKDLGGTRNIRLALGNYYGDPSSSYASEVLAKARAYRGERPLQGVAGVPGGPARPRTAKVAYQKYIPAPPPLVELGNLLAPKAPGTASPEARSPLPGDSVTAHLQTPAESARVAIEAGEVSPFQSRIENRTRTVRLPADRRAQMRRRRRGAVPAGDLRAIAAERPRMALVKAGRIAQKKFGLTVSEQRKFGGTPTSGHAENSWHYSNRAIDVSGSAKQLRRFFLWAARTFGSQLTELFYDPMGYYYDSGRRVRGAIGGHGSHVHLAL